MESSVKGQKKKIISKTRMEAEANKWRIKFNKIIITPYTG